MSGFGPGERRTEARYGRGQLFHMLAGDADRPRGLATRRSAGRLLGWAKPRVPRFVAIHDVVLM
jgi:hypothetical protein